MKKLRSAEEVYWKTQAWASICERSFAEQDTGRLASMYRREEILQNASLNEFEKGFFSEERLSKTQLNVGTWYCEPLAAALFIMGVRDELPYDSDVSMLGPLNKAMGYKLEDAGFRPMEEIESTMKMVFWAHRRIFSYLCKHQKIDSLMWAKSCNVELEELVEVQENDIVFADEPLFMKAKEELPYGGEFQKVTGSRLNVFRWVFGEQYEGCFVDTLSSPYRMYQKDKCDFAPLYEVESNQVDITGPEQPVLPAGGTPLRVAVAKKDFPKIEELPAAQGALDQTNIKGMTPLVLATYLNSIETASKLIGLGADPDGVDGQGRYPLVVALNEESNEMAEMLIQRGAGVDGPAGTDPPLFDVVRSAKPEAVKLLLKNGAAVDERNWHLRTPLMIGALEGNLAEVEILLSHNPVLSYVDGDQNSALHFACRFGKTEVAQRLIKAGHDLEMKNEKGMTPLAFATFQGQRETAIACIEAGAKIDVESNDGQTPLHYSCLFEDLELSAKLIEKGADVNKVAKDGYTPLSAAACVRCNKILKLLLDAGAEVKGSDLEGSTPLHVIANNGDVESTNMVLAKNPPLEETNQHGHTPLVAACNGPNPEGVVEVLVDHGVNVDHQDNEGYTALHYMAARGMKSTVEKLLQANASTSIKCNQGLSAKDIAERYEHQEIVELLA